MAAATEAELNPGACCPHCGGRRCPSQYTQYSGRRTIRTRLCRDCRRRFREIAIAVPLVDDQAPDSPKD